MIKLKVADLVKGDKLTLDGGMTWHVVGEVAALGSQGWHRVQCTDSLARTFRPGAQVVVNKRCITATN